MIINDEIVEFDSKTKINLIELIKSNDNNRIRQIPLSCYNMNYSIEYESNSISPLLACCVYRNLEILHYLLNLKNVSVDYRVGENQITALMFVCSLGDYELIRILIEAGASLELIDSQDHSALYYIYIHLKKHLTSFSKKRESLMIIELLLKRKADIDEIIDKEDNTTMLSDLIIEKINNNSDIIDIVEFLLERGAKRSILYKQVYNIINLAEQEEYSDKFILLTILRNTKQRIFYNETPSPIFEGILPKHKEQAYWYCCS